VHRSDTFSFIYSSRELYFFVLLKQRVWRLNPSMVDLLEGLVTPLEADDVQSCSLLTRMFETPLPPLLSSFHFRQGLGCVMILCVSCDWFHHYIYDIHVQHFRMNEHGSFAFLYIGTTVWSCLFRLVMYWLSYWIGHYLIWCMIQVQIFLYPDAHGASRVPRASPTHGPL